MCACVYKMSTAAVLLSLVLSLAVSVAVGLDPECGASGWQVPPRPAALTLRQVNAVIRHGDRTPWGGDLCWPEDSSVWDCQLTNGQLPMLTDHQYGKVLPRVYRKIYSFGDETLRGNCSLSQLTSIGFNQQKTNGHNLAQAYVDGTFLSKTMDPTQLYLRSDDIPRTLMSAESLMLGMYPPDKPATFTQTLEIHTMDPTYDYMVANPMLCPRTGYYSNTFNQSQAWLDHHPTTLALLEDIYKTTGYNLTEDNLIHYTDCLRTHYCHKLELPHGMTMELYQRAWAEVSWQFYNLYQYPSVGENSRTGIGFLLKELGENMNATVNGKKMPKFLLYSGHDTTLMPLLTAMLVDDGVWSPYASMILMELFENTTATPQPLPAIDRFSMRLIYNGKVVSPVFCKLPGGLCHFKDISDYLNTVIPPDDYTKLCSVSSQSRRTFGKLLWNF